MITINTKKYTKIVIIILSLIAVLLIIFKQINPIRPTPAPSTKIPTLTDRLEIPEDPNVSGRLTFPKEINPQEFLFYDKESEETILVTDDGNNVLYQGKVDSYAYFEPYLYVLNKQYADKLVQINTQDNTQKTIKLSAISPIEFITSCPNSNQFLIIGNYSAKNRTSSVFKFSPETNSFDVLSSNIGATSLQCTNDVAVIFSYADFAGASKITVLKLSSKEILLNANGNDFSTNADGTLIAIENGNITIYNLLTKEAYEIPDSSRYHFSWYQQSLLLVQNNRPGISIQLFSLDGTTTPLNTPNQSLLTIRKLLKVFNHGFLYQSLDGSIQQEQFNEPIKS